MVILEIIINIVFEFFMGEIIGLNVRYYILKLFNPKITREQLSGNKSNLHGIYNFIVGLPVFSFICISIAYFIYYLIKL